MTPAEQEALSRKYASHHILRLESGEYAVFAPDYKLVYIGGDPLALDLAFKPPEAKPKLKFDISALLRRKS